MVIDLHTHSTASDGTDSPAELVALAARQGIDVVALTDHDTAAGWAEAEKIASTSGITLVRGTEFSCRTNGMNVHLLSYLHNPQAPVIVAHNEHLQKARRKRVREMVAKLAADFPITWEGVQAQAAPGATIGRPHIADALVAAGVVPDRDAAFATMLNHTSPYYVRYEAPDAVAMVRAVREAGGVPVVAHPRAISRGRIVSDDLIRAMTEAGLAGIEVRHRDNSADEQVKLGALARQLGLFETGSSDYHGTGKPNRLAENTTAVEVFREIAARAAGVEVIGLVA